MKVKTTLQELMPNEFEVGENEELVAKVSLERLNLIASAITQQHEEIERLNNIINELEKWCYEESKYDESYDKEVVTFENVLERIKELKGSDKE